jgi:predicted transcriptional regulator
MDKKRPCVSFESAAFFCRLMTYNRWELLKLFMAGAGPLSIRALASRLVGRNGRTRNEKSVHGDVQRLLDAGVLYKNAYDLIEFPFGAVHVNFMVPTPARPTGATTRRGPPR